MSESIVARQVLEALRNVHAYAYEDERDDYNACPAPDHIFKDLQILDQLRQELESGDVLLVRRNAIQTIRQLVEDAKREILCPTRNDVEHHVLLENLTVVAEVLGKLPASTSTTSNPAVPATINA